MPQNNKTRARRPLSADVARKAVPASLLLLSLMAGTCAAGLVPMPDEEMAKVEGQALFVADKIPGNLTGSDSLSTPYTYYRLGLDADLFMNLNIDKLQLGCGGFNEGLLANGCDIDLDFVRFAGTGNSGGPTSDFLMSRPYLEIAIKNDGDKTRREVIGIKIGAQTVDGLLSIGRTYISGQFNQENGGTGIPSCNPTYGDPIDNGSRLACHTGVNTISGFLNAELSARGSVVTALGTRGACIGNTTVNTSDRCDAADTFITALAGTRMTELGVKNTALYLDSPICLFICFEDGFADIRENLRFLHSVVLDDTMSKDFFISMQRERMRWPVYNYTAPYDTDGWLASSSSRNGDTTNRAYHYPANTGFWMNVQYAAALNNNIGTINLGDFGDMVAALGEGANVSNINLGQVPLDNCFGAAAFC